MDAIVWFRYGPVHVPPGRRKWTDGPRIEVVKGGRTYELQIRRPVRIHTHEIEYESGIKKIVDAYLIFAVGCQIIDTPDGYREVADVALIYMSTILERLRVRTRQPHLQLRSISELSVPEVQHADGKQNQELTRRFQEWMLDQEGDRPLPELEIGEWNQLKSNADCGIEFSEWVEKMKVPLHESLLRDAELASESDPRVAILYAALACDMFIQHWLENNGYIRSRKWLN